MPEPNPYIAIQSLISLAIIWWIFWLFVDDWMERRREARRTVKGS